MRTISAIFSAVFLAGCVMAGGGRAPKVNVVVPTCPDAQLVELAITECRDWQEEYGPLSYETLAAEYFSQSLGWRKGLASCLDAMEDIDRLVKECEKLD